MAHVEYSHGTNGVGDGDGDGDGDGNDVCSDTGMDVID